MTKLRQLWLLTAVGSLLVMAAGYFLLVSPKRSDAASIRTEAADQEQANARLRTQIQMLNRQKKDLPKQQAELQKFAASIPNNPALPALIRSLSNAAETSGVELVALSPAAPTRVAAVSSGQVAGAAPAAQTLPLAQIPITVKVAGRYSEVSQFFSEIEGLPRAFLLSGVNVVPEPPKAKDGAAPAGNVYTGRLAATLTGSLYMTVKAPPAPKPVATVSAPAE
ncbi:MAG TPA: type 4a pilus biogenesis protein PilO [Mycobacteriales bacterium]|jgi:type IV pilus assembly protein PilO